MAALLEGFTDDGCIKGLFGGDSSSDDEDNNKKGEENEYDEDKDTQSRTGLETDTNRGQERGKDNDKVNDTSKETKSDTDNEVIITPPPLEFSYFTSTIPLKAYGSDNSSGDGVEIKLETNKSRGIAHQVLCMYCTLILMCIYCNLMYFTLIYYITCGGDRNR
jgi:hypothetical protein